MKVAIIGGGAAGFFAAVHVKINYPEAQVILYEKTRKLLAKVKVSGGGRCNVTNGCTTVSELVRGYPRGSKHLKKAFRVFDNQDIRTWFESRGVPLKTEADGRVFPVSNDSQSIIDCLLGAARASGIKIETETGIRAITPENGRLTLSFSSGKRANEMFDKAIVAIGGAPKRKGLEWLETLGHEIVDPVPSLFTFNMPGEAITELMGVVADPVQVSLPGTKLQTNGPLLITHWGMSGPAVLKLSAFGARILKEKGYAFQIHINWVNVANQEAVKEDLLKIVNAHSKKQLSNVKPYRLPERLWLYLLESSELPAQKIWGELGKKGVNKLTSILTQNVYAVNGKTTFKQEFVTCGGVSLRSVDIQTMQSKVCKNLYFAGEVLDIDGITGGYNFQAAWTTAFIAGKLQ